ncbi:unnamed protein product [Moneuplotes crassus]|uniref:Uncharacterized protein n=1 Tax=Euplotes crassus TaxID=5936 RepID=A0AAD1XHB5_EUPCR|nr:unnamed protein product [Moneuplotes crassus]
MILGPSVQILVDFYPRSVKENYSNFYFTKSCQEAFYVQPLTSSHYLLDVGNFILNSQAGLF